MGDMVEFPSNGHTAQGYLALPESGSGPGLVVIQEWWGLVPHIEDVCDRFAAEGFVALAPDLYHGESTTEPDEAGKLMMAMNLDQAGRDMGGAVKYLQGHEATPGGPVGVTGFCMGGGLAMVFATQQGDDIGACVAWYGLIPWPQAQPDWSAMTAPLLMHIAEKDEYFNAEAADELAAKLRELGKEVEVHVYPGADHAFFNDTRPEVYDADAASTAWDRTLSFLRDKL
jgi:carboxymethylenebutenolidase